jgi:hypothetical protein
MRLATQSPDDQLLARLQAPPDVRDGVESLAYWQRRRRGLPWYRLVARREAARMTVVWERRVRAAIVRQRDVPMTVRLEGAALVGMTLMRRWGRRTRFALAATAVLCFVVLPVAAVVALLARLF